MYRRLSYIVTYLFIAIIIVQSGTVWSTDILYGKVISLLFDFTIIFAIIGCYIKRVYERIPKLLILYPIMLAYLLLGVLINKSQDNFFHTFVTIFTLILIVSIWILDNNIDFIKVFSNIITAYCKFNLVTFFLFSVLKVIEPTEYLQPFDSGIVYQSFYNIHFSSQTGDIGGILYTRNGGIFVEPGAYSLFLVATLAIVLFRYERCRIRDVILIAMTIITTLSSAGIIIMSIFIIIKLLITKVKSKKIKYLKIFFVPVVTISVLSITSIMIIDKVTDYGLQSVTVRTDDVKVGLELFIEKPISGWGYKNTEDLEKRQNGFLRGKELGGLSNGIIRSLYMNGLYIIPFYMMPLIFLTRKKEISKIQKFIIMIYMILELCSYPFEGTNFMITMLCLSWAGFCVKKNKLINYTSELSKGNIGMRGVNGNEKISYNSSINL